MGILPQLLANALISGSIYALAAAGLALSYGLLKILNFSHGHFMMAGAYLFYWAAREHSLSPVPASLVVVAGTALLGAAALETFVRPFLRFSTLLPFVTTLSLATLLESAVSMRFGVNVKSLSSSDTVESFEFLGAYITPTQVGIICTAFVVLGVLGFLVHWTALGRRIRALAESPWAAEALGIHGRLIQQAVFIAAALLAALSGVLVGFESDIQPTMGNVYTIKTFAAMTLGGLGSVWGTVIGSYLLGLIENLSLGIEIGGYSIPSGYKDAFAFLVILLVLLFKPEGLFSSSRRRL